MEQDQPSGEESAAPRLGIDRDGIDWDAIKHAYIHGDMSLERIAAEFGSSYKTIVRRAKAGGWVRLVGTKPLKSGRKPRPPGVPPPKPATADESRRRKLVQRLFEILDAKLRELEARMHNGLDPDAAPQSAADTERDARSLNTFARLYAKLVELDEAAKKSGAGEGSGSGNAMRSSDDADRLRRDLALRLQRLNQARNA